MANYKFPMLNEGKRRDIHERIYKFALSVLDVTKFFPKTTENIILIRQVIRSSSSIGANASEADGAESKKEFIHRFTIAKKEAKESYYWLSLICDHNLSLRKQFEPLLKENNEIILIISKIIINTKKNSK